MRNIKILAAVEGFLFGVAMFFLMLDKNGGPEGLMSRRLYEDQAARYHNEVNDDVRSIASEYTDLQGYLTVEGTSIDYPVMRDRTDSEGNYYYLDHNYTGQPDASGCPFIRHSVRLDDDLIEVFAHNNSNGTMFADLIKFEDEDFFNEYGNIIFDTVEGRRTYQVMAVLNVDVYGDDYTFWGWHNFPDDDSEDEFISQIESNALVISEDGIDMGSQYLLLVTCEYSHTEGRRIVVAVRTS